VREWQLSVILKRLRNEPWPILIVVGDRKATKALWHDSGRLSSDSNRECLEYNSEEARTSAVSRKFHFNVCLHKSASSISCPSD
jgi:hypothetical protein